MHDIFCFTDIHGMYDLYKTIMNYCDEQDPEATIVFIGDACDRGPDGYKIMKELLDNPKVLYLKGNHEDMFTKSAREIRKFLSFDTTDKNGIQEMLKACKHYDYRYASIQDSLNNGGLDTLTDWILDGMPMDLIERVEKLPLTFSYENYDFVHTAGVYEGFKSVYDKEYEGESVPEWDVEYVLWSRSSLDFGWAPGRTVVFGHTPTPYLVRFLDESNMKEIAPVRYKSKIPSSMTGEKLDMDTGAFFTGKAYVLNVLTGKIQGFGKVEK